MSEKGKARFWMMVPVVLLGGLTTTVLFFVHVALSDPSFAVQDRYYTKALSWDEHVAAERRSAALGWRLSVSTARAAGAATDLEVSLVDRAGQPVRGANLEVAAFAVARSRSVSRAAFVERAAGDYHARLATPRGGRWKMSFDALRGGDRYDQTVTQELPGDR